MGHRAQSSNGCAVGPGRCHRSDGLHPLAERRCGMSQAKRVREASARAKASACSKASNCTKASACSKASARTRKPARARKLSYTTEADYMRRILWIVLHRSNTCLRVAGGGVAASAGGAAVPVASACAAVPAAAQGHHFFIDRCGALHHVVPMGTEGSRTPGFNHHSLSVCIEGGVDAEGRPEAYCTPVQWMAIDDVLRILHKLFPKARIVGVNRLKAPKR